MSDGGNIEFIDDVSPYMGSPRKPKPMAEIMMAPNVGTTAPSYQELGTMPVNDKQGLTIPAYFQPELFMGPLPSGSMPTTQDYGGYQPSGYSPGYPSAYLPPPADTTNIKGLPADKYGSMKALDMNCRDVADHIKGCPVCGQLHKSNSYMYIGVIVFLIIVCFFLGRKFFD